MPQVVRGAEHLVSAGELQEGVAVLSRHGHHRAAVAVARSRLPHDSELVTSVMRAWAGQSQADGEWEEGSLSSNIYFPRHRHLRPGGQVLAGHWPRHRGWGVSGEAGREGGGEAGGRGDR